MKKVEKDIFFKLIFNVLRIYVMPKTMYHFYLEKKKIDEIEKIIANSLSLIIKRCR